MDKSQNQFCVYLHIRPDTNTVFYVGIGLKKRPKERRGRNIHWHHVVNKNNGNYITEVLCKDCAKDSVYQIEIALIKFYGRRNNKTGILVNMTNGGDGLSGLPMSAKNKEILAQRSKGNKYSLGKKKSAEACKAIGDAHRGMRHTNEFKARLSEIAKNRPPASKECRAKMSATRTGKKASAETRAKISASNTGRVYSDTSKAKMSAIHKGKKISELSLYKMFATRSVRQYVIEQVSISSGEVIAKFVMPSIAERITGISSACISSALRSKSGKSSGYVWRKSYDLSNINQLVAMQIAA